MIRLNERFTITLPQGSISEEGMRLVNQYVGEQGLQSALWKALNPDESRLFLPVIPQEWAWQWLVTGKGEYVGTFPKRVSKYYWQEHKLKCPTAFIQQIGNLARQHSNDTVSYDFDFVATFNWNAGDYGDNGSCFWGSRANARRILEENNALAIRFYKEDKGHARAWIAQLSDNRYILFNGFGFSGNPTLVSARVMATWLGLNYKKISLTNHGKTDDTLWINSDIGYLISTSEQAENVNSHDLGFGDSPDENDSDYTCHNCNDSVSEDDVYFGADDMPYCQDCFYDSYDYCEHCGECHDRDNMTYIDGNGYVCEDCISEHYTYCEHCYEYHLNSDVLFIEDEYYCETCASNIATTCEECEEWILLENATSTEDGNYCEACKPKEDIEE